MRKKLLLTIFVLIFIAGLTGAPFIVFAAHDTVTATSDFDIYLTGSSETLLMRSGSELAGFVVYSTYVTLDLENGSSITITSGSRKTIIVDPVIAEVRCYAAESYSEIALTSTTTQTVTLTLGDTCPAFPSTGGSGGGGGGGGGGSTPTPAPTPIPTTTKPEDYNLKEGDLIRAEGDWDIFIINQYGYKRLFLNPTIFNMYGHLNGGWDAVKTVSTTTRDAFITTHHYRYVEEDKVYQMKVTGEDIGTLHWINMTAENFSAQGGKSEAIFTINKSEFDWYSKGADVTSLQ